jgi:arylsulfatase
MRAIRREDASAGERQSRPLVAGPDKLAPGKHVILLDFKYDGGGAGKGGTATLTVDDNAGRPGPDRAHHPDPCRAR